MQELMQELIEYLFSRSSWISAIVLVWLGVGLGFRRRPKIHIPIMASAFLVDFLNVLLIELNRDAIQQALETAGTTGQWILKFHIFVSVVCIVCYVIAVITGRRLLTKGKGRKVHRTNAGVFVVCRVLNFVSSFWV